ncbi:MAG: J domain-containing protein [Terracidiphilus sp.]
MGEDAEPDPLFFVESWTLGMLTAVENWQKRRLGQNNRERQIRRFPEFGSFGAQSTVQQSELRSDFAKSSSANEQTTAYGTGWSLHSIESTPLPSHFQSLQEWNPFAAEGTRSKGEAHPMSHLRACELLGVTPTSTRRQIKAAYRRMVNQNHPDRLQRRTDGARRLANDQMAEINEAYHLLCRGLL